MSQDRNDFFDDLRDSAQSGIDRAEDWVAGEARKRKNRLFGLRLARFRVFGKSLQLWLTVEPDNNSLEAPNQAPKLPQK